MNYTQQEAITQNFKVLAGLKDLFQLLTEHGAVIGRNSARKLKGSGGRAAGVCLQGL
ncbi:hypothetical protein [Salmonella enterica]|uniref:hypothetical protein n=1 Tax=Salmonella enterica TaxID=28901 RepID=UPI00387987F3